MKEKHLQLLMSKDLDKQLKTGTYTINYYVEDGMGLSNTVSITVTINNSQQQNIKD